MSDIEVQVKQVGEDRSGTYRLEAGSKISDLLEELGQNPEAVVTRRDGKIVPEADELEDGDQIEVIPVVSGG